MKFNGGKFNLDGYNLSSSTETILFANVKTTFSGSGKLTAISSLRGAARSTFSGTARPALSVTLCGPTSAGFSVLAKAGLSVPIHALASSKFGGNTPYMRTTAYTFIDLSGLVLMPGETLRIDTDTITVTKDGVNAIEYWQLGSTPFALGRGENEITYFDSDEERHARLSVTWRDRWI